MSAVPVFESLSGDEAAKLRPLAVLKEYERDEVVFEQGDPPDVLHFVVSGRVKIVRRRPDGNEIILEILGPGEPLGVIAALEGFSFPAAAVVHETARVLSLPCAEFLALLRTDFSVVRALLAGFCRRNIQLTRRLADFPGTVEARIARFFETLAERIGRREEERIVIPLPLSRRELADLAGTSLETAIRVLSRWGKEGVVLTHRDGFTIPDLAALRARSRGDS